MQLYLCWDGDKIGREIGRAAMADDVEGLRRKSAAIDRGNEIWKSWALLCGGSLISMGGDEGRAIVPADKIGDLPKIREQYASAVGATISVGVGKELHEAEKSLIAAKLRGGDKIVFFGEDVEETLRSAETKSEADKQHEAYLGKALPMNAGTHAGFAGPSHSTGVSRPTAPKAEASEHSQAEAARAVYMQERPPAPEMTHAAKDFEQQFHDHAIAHEQQEHVRTAAEVQSAQKLKEQVAGVLKQVQSQLPMLDQLKQAAPQAYKSVVALAQSVIALARALPSEGEVQKSEGEEGEPLMKAAAKKVTKAPAKKPAKPVKFSNPPKAKQEVGKGDYFPKRITDVDAFNYFRGTHLGSRADLNKLPYEVESYTLVDLPLAKLPQNIPADDPRVKQYARLSTPFPPILVGTNGRIPDGHHRISAAKVRGDKSIRAYVPTDEAHEYMAMMKKFEEGAYPSSADDAEIDGYVRQIHTGSRANLRGLPYDTEYELQTVLVKNIPSGVPADDHIAKSYSKLDTPFPPIVLRPEGGTPWDGNHRITAARLRGDKHIRAYVPVSKSEPKHKKPGTKPAKGAKSELEPSKKLPKKGSKELEKSHERLPGAAAYDSVTGGQTGEVVRHSNGTKSIREARAGGVMGPDPSQHIVSSRNQNST